MSHLRIVPPDETPPSEHRPPSGLFRWLGFPALFLGVTGTCAFVWWSATAETRELRALPDAQRLPLYHRTLDNLKTICDPAAPRSLRDFCQRQAELASKFRECDADPDCQDLARRHLSQPRR